MLNTSSRVYHTSYGNGSIRRVISSERVEVYFDCGFSEIVNTEFCQDIGKIPESIEIGEYVVYNGKTIYVDDICFSGSKVIVTDRNGARTEIDRFQTTISRIRTL